MLVIEEAMHNGGTGDIRGGRGAYGKSVYLLLRFSVNLKPLKKKWSLLKRWTCLFLNYSCKKFSDLKQHKYFISQLCSSEFWMVSADTLSWVQNQGISCVCVDSYWKILGRICSPVHSGWQQSSVPVVVGLRFPLPCHLCQRSFLVSRVVCILWFRGLYTFKARNSGLIPTDPWSKNWCVINEIISSW